MIETIEFKGTQYPALQASGNAARFAIPFASEYCKGAGLDIGAGHELWAFPGARIVDPAITGNADEHAMAIPWKEKGWDYIFSSHCLEHIKEPWCAVLDYWNLRLKYGGNLFLYLPHPDQKYWKPWHNRKHVHLIHPEDICEYLHDSDKWGNFFVSSFDLNHSFSVIAEKSFS